MGEYQFTFHHVSIKTEKLKAYNPAYITFTFHHVSIKTIMAKNEIVLSGIFTFHHVSIKTLKIRQLFRVKKHSHSTMYLLKHKEAVDRKDI